MASTVAGTHRRLPLAVLVLLTMAALTTPATPAHANETAQARKLLEDGDKHMRQGDLRRARGRDDRARPYYLKALDSYQKAYALVPRSSIFFAIAEAEAKLGRYIEAIAHYQRVIAEVDSDELKQQALQRVEGLRSFVAALVLTVAPDGAEISIDGELRGLAPLAEPILLAARDHTITITADGHAPYEEVVVLSAGIETQREIRLEKILVVVKTPVAAAPAGPPPLTSTPAPVAAPGKGKIIVGGVATGSLAAGATVSGLMALKEKKNPNPEDALISGKTLALATNVLIGTTVLAAGYTVYQYAVYRPRRRAYERERNDVSVWMSPYYDGAGGGLAVAGHF